MTAERIPTPLRLLRGSTGRTDDRKPDRRTEAVDLRMELMAAGQEMVALGHRIALAIHADRPDIADQVAARLIVLGEGYRTRGTA